MTTKIHETYPENISPPRPFAGPRSALKGGEYLGRTTQYEKLLQGDIVTSTGGGHYYFDPGLRIEGTSWLRADATWFEVQRDNECVRVATQPEAQPCLDPAEDTGTTFPCSFCANDERVMAQGLCLHAPDYKEPS